MNRRRFAAGSVAASLAPAQHGPGKRILVFDVNETLLDVRALPPHFERAFGSADLLRDWFSTLLLYSMTQTLTGAYSTFGDIAGAALDMTAQAAGKPLAGRPDILGPNLLSVAKQLIASDRG